MVESHCAGLLHNLLLVRLPCATPIGADPGTPRFASRRHCCHRDGRLRGRPLLRQLPPGEGVYEAVERRLPPAARRWPVKWRRGRGLGRRRSRRNGGRSSRGGGGRCEGAGAVDLADGRLPVEALRLGFGEGKLRADARGRG